MIVGVWLSILPLYWFDLRPSIWSWVYVLSVTVVALIMLWRRV